MKKVLLGFILLLNCQLVISASISGKVVADTGGGVLANINICVLNRTDFVLFVCDITDSNGDYTVSGLPASNDLLVVVNSTNGQIYLTEYYDDHPISDKVNATGVNVSSGDAMNINFSLADAAVITGQFTRADAGTSVSVSHLRLHTVGGSRYQWIYVGLQVDNTYTAIVPPGDYYALFVGNNGLIDELYAGSGNPGIHCPRLLCDISTLGQPISAVVGAPVNNINGELDLGSRISGLITENGAALPNIVILFYTDLGEYAGFARSDTSGIYLSVAGFPLGNYITSSRYLEYGLQVVENYNRSYVSKVYNETVCGEPCNLLLGNLIPLDGTNSISGINFNFQKILIFEASFE